MRQKSGLVKEPAEKVIKRIGLEGLRGEESIAELCRREGIARCEAKFSQTSTPGLKTDVRLPAGS